MIFKEDIQKGPTKKISTQSEPLQNIQLLVNQIKNIVTKRWKRRLKGIVRSTIINFSMKQSFSDIHLGSESDFDQGHSEDSLEFP